MSVIDDWNYARDPRNCDAVKAPVLYMESGEEKTLPMKWSVCNVCDGKGTTVNPSIDAGGLSAEDFHDDPDFAESYFRGDFDQTCRACNGRTTVPVVAWEKLDAETRAAYEAQLKADADYEAERLAEIRMGA